MDSTRPSADLIRALATAEAAGSLVGHVFDYAVEQPVERFTRRDRVFEQVEGALTEHVLSTAIETVARGFVERERKRAKQRGDKWRDWLPCDAVEQLTELTGRPVVIDEPLLLAAIEQPAIRAGVRAMVKDTLDAFVKSVTTGGLLGSSGRKRGLLGGLGGQIQKQLGRGVSLFVDGSLNVILKRLIARLGQPETQEQLGRLIQSSFVRELETPTKRFWGIAKGLPVDEVLDLVPGIVMHNIDREALKEIISEEVGLALDAVGTQSVRELLADDEQLSAWRADVSELLVPFVVEVAASGKLEGWFGDVVDEATS